MNLAGGTPPSVSDLIQREFFVAQRNRRRVAFRLALLLVSVVPAYLFLGATPASAQATSCVDYLSDLNLYLACSGGPTLTVTPGTSSPGGNITVEVSGWLPGSTVAITISCNGSPVALGNITIGSNSQGTGNFTVPVDCPLGPQVATGTGPNMLNVITSREGPIVLVSSTTTLPGGGGSGSGGSGNNSGGGSGSGGSGSGSGALPNTGSNTGRMVTLGSALIVIGGAALYGSLRSRSTKRSE